MYAAAARVGSGVLAFIPSPSGGGFSIGPLKVRAYGFCIALGVVAAVWLSNRRWLARGGDPTDIGAIATWGVPAGVIGARLYHVATDWKSFRGRWFDVVKIWEGGLGIWGGVALGVTVGVIVARRRNMPVGPLLDTVAPAIPLAQAIGRWGNWFNIELFGGPTKLPWALEVPPAKRPAAFADRATFHPTFLYESLWNLLVVAVVLLVERRYGKQLKRGRLFAVYVATYTFGRFWIERVRVDFASKVLGLRINEWTAMIVFVVALGFVVTARARTTTPSPATAGQPHDPLAAGHDHDHTDHDHTDHDHTDHDHTVA